MLAIRAVKSKQLRLMEASRYYNVSRGTLYNHLKGRDRHAPKESKDVKRHLTEREERALVEVASSAARSGYPLSKAALMTFALVSTLLYNICMYVQYRYVHKII